MNIRRLALAAGLTAAAFTTACQPVPRPVLPTERPSWEPCEVVPLIGGDAYSKTPFIDDVGEWRSEYGHLLGYSQQEDSTAYRTASCARSAAAYPNQSWRY